MKFEKMEHLIALWLLIVGGFVWGSTVFTGAVTGLIASWGMVGSVIYGLVGVSSLFITWELIKGKMQ
jgi:hypothetical protein